MGKIMALKSVHFEVFGEVQGTLANSVWLLVVLQASRDTIHLAFILLGVFFRKVTD